MNDTSIQEQREAWLAERPASVREKVLAYPPDKLYRLKQTGQHAKIDSYSEAEDGTCETCCITAWYPPLPFAHVVFGVYFTDLEEIPREGAP